jgi:hypothetical protein
MSVEESQRWDSVMQHSGGKRRIYLAYPKVAVCSTTALGGSCMHKTNTGSFMNAEKEVRMCLPRMHSSTTASAPWAGNDEWCDNPVCGECMNKADSQHLLDHTRETAGIGRLCKSHSDRWLKNQQTLYKKLSQQSKPSEETQETPENPEDDDEETCEESGTPLIGDIYKYQLNLDEGAWRKNNLVTVLLLLLFFALSALLLLLLLLLLLTGPPPTPRGISRCRAALEQAPNQEVRHLRIFGRPDQEGVHPCGSE